jgi:hypothetical protein
MLFHKFDTENKIFIESIESEILDNKIKLKQQQEQ